MASDDQCAIHGYEPIPISFYKVCRECGHCYVTGHELVEKDRKVRERLGFPDVEPLHPSDISVCPLCAHTF